MPIAMWETELCLLSGTILKISLRYVILSVWKPLKKERNSATPISHLSLWKPFKKEIQLNTHLLSLCVWKPLKKERNSATPISHLSQWKPFKKEIQLNTHLLSLSVWKPFKKEIQQYPSLISLCAKTPQARNSAAPISHLSENTQ